MVSKDSLANDEIDLLEFAGKLLAHWKLLLVVSLAGAAVTYLYSMFFIPKVYQSDATIYVQQSQSSLGRSLRDLPIPDQLKQQLLKLPDYPAEERDPEAKCDLTDGPCKRS